MVLNDTFNNISVVSWLSVLWSRGRISLSYTHIPLYLLNKKNTPRNPHELSLSNNLEKDRTIWQSFLGPDRKNLNIFIWVPIRLQA